MKPIRFTLLALAMMLAAPASFTSCQEDAPETNYTMNVSVINDFTKVVEAINNGSLKNEEAIKKLTEALDKMNANQQTKLQAIIDVLTSVNSTLEAKLVAVEAAMKAQTLSLEKKLELLEKAIQALPNYTAQLEALQKAIRGLPNYNDKFDALVAGLGAMKTQLEALGTAQAGIATEIGKTTEAVKELIATVKGGTSSATEALAQIIQKLAELKEAIAKGGGATPPTPTPPTTPIPAPSVAFNSEYVDLGLSVLWATCNLGASSPEEAGNYYAWGETEPKNEYTQANYKWGSDDTNLAKYNATDGKTILDREDDAATANLGSSWRMPTLIEVKELVLNCTWTWTTQAGTNGYKVTGTNGNSIFLPASGYCEGLNLKSANLAGSYWGGDLDPHLVGSARSLEFLDSYGWNASSRFLGLAIRPVCHP